MAPTDSWATLRDSIAEFQGLLKSLSNVFTSLRKYENSFSADAKDLLSSTVNLVSQIAGSLGSIRLGTDIASYLCADDALSIAKAGQDDVSAKLARILAGGVPVQRSSKEELNNTSRRLQGLTFDLDDRHIKHCMRLRKLVSEVTAQSTALDTLESRLDDILRAVLLDVYGSPSLTHESLPSELEALQSVIASANASGASTSATYLSLALNSLQRLHAHLLQDESGESDDDVLVTGGAAPDVDDEEEDLFNIPLPSAVKMADSGKYFMLAQPISEQPAKDFVILMDRDTDGQEGEGGSDEFDRIEVDGDALPVSPTSPEAPEAIPMPTSPAASTPPVSPPRADSIHSIPSKAASREEVISLDPATPETNALALTEPGPATDEKMHQFMSFLTGANPGACMFHAQMKLSPEGCWKLANFLKSSARVRALSLSHNYLGDNGLAIICEGLRCSPSVTALDLPDNDISDIGVKVLVEALASNTSLTQLQLAYNRIGDEGAVELAKIIASSTSLKKLGLAYNNINKTGCQALIAAINKNQSLKQLQLLPGNPVEERDAKILAKALKRNKKFSIKTFLGLD